MKIFRSYAILLVGLTIMAFGVAFSIVGNLGTSPISSLPYVTSQISGFTVGQTTIVLHCCLILGQILLLRKNYKWIQLTQLFVAFFFGYITDFAVWVTQSCAYHNYFQQWIFCLLGIVLCAIGVAMEVIADVIMLAGEGMALALVQVTQKPFAKVKVCLDSALVTTSIVLSLLFLHQLVGVREGTIAAALLVGPTSKVARKVLNQLL